MSVTGDGLSSVLAWIEDDPDAQDQAELRELLDRAYPPAGDGAGAAHRRRRGTSGVAGPVRGTAGVRDGGAARCHRGGPEPDEPRRGPGGDGGGSGLAAGRGGRGAGGPWSGRHADVRGHEAGHGERRTQRDAAGARVSVVVGCDARHRSAEFADEAARVLAAAGVTVHMLPQPGPTPLLAFAVRHLGVSAGVMVTASHNPAADNGYKLYLSDGAQVIPPVDGEIEARMAALGPLAQVPVADPDSPLIIRHGDEVAQAYLDAVVGRAAGGPGRRRRPRAGLSVVYTPMHGVAGELMLRAMAQAGFAAPQVVAAQAQPDPDFPTVAYPNPEEPGALDLALADARRLDADLIVASDPDGDRLAVAARRPVAGSGGWLVLTGDQAGSLLGASMLDADGGRSRARAGGWWRPRSCPPRCCPRSRRRPEPGTPRR